MMMTMKQLERKLQKADQKQSYLYLFCNFVSLLLITSYAAMMFSPTVLLILPEGGDSRKTGHNDFCAGALWVCGLYRLRLRSVFPQEVQTARDTDGAWRFAEATCPSLFREVLILSSVSSLLGIVAGFPFVYLLWNGFRLFIVDTDEMRLQLDYRCLSFISSVFVLVVAFSCVTAYRYLRRTNIIDVVHEEHKNEPVRELGRWCGPVGILLIFAGAVCGYEAPAVYMNLFSAYPTELISIFYAPVFVGLYMVMLYSVVHGWAGKRKHPYKNIISRSMMKFQGKQTVNNLLVSTVLIAGSAFAIFTFLCWGRPGTRRPFASV